MELDKIPLWRGDHVAIRQLAEDFARYIYLPRLKNSSVLLQSIQEGIALMTWTHDSFAYADSFDEAANRYRGLRGGQLVTLHDGNGPGLLVKPEVAEKQLKAEIPTPSGGGKTEVTIPGGGGGVEPEPETGTPEISEKEPEPPKPRRFHGTVTLDTTRVGHDAGRIAEEVIAHLSGMAGAQVTVTLEVETTIPSGAPDQVVRTVTENCNTLKFSTYGFEEE